MSDHPSMSGEAFAEERLRDNPQLTFEAIRQVAEQVGINLQPIHYGRARRQLGLTGVPVAATAQHAAVHSTEVHGNAVPSNAVEPASVLPRPAATPQAHAPAPSPATAPAPAPATAPAPALAPAPSAAAPGNTKPATADADQTTPRKSTPGFEFVLDALRDDNTLSYGDLKVRAEQRGHKIAPIMYGRAKALLGLVPVAARGEGKNRKATAHTQVMRTQQTDQTKLVATIGQQLDSVRNLDDLVQIIKDLDADRRRLRGLLEQIADTIDAALGYSDEQ
jgi:hypothetical protein